MRIVALELPARFGQPERGLAAIELELAAGPPCDLVLLPEAALSGYVGEDLSCDPSAAREPLDGPTCAALAALARRHGSHVCGPIIEADGVRTFNSAVVLDPRGELVAHYRKRHPWFPERWATKGDLEHPVFELEGLRFGLAICFDVHFLPRESRDFLDRIDVLLFPSAWVDEDAVDLREDLFASLAQRFELWIVNANWGPGRPHLRGQGRSRVVSPSGRVVEASPGRELMRVEVEIPARLP